MPEPTAVYRHYDRQGALLYIGVTNDVTRRLDQHVDTKTWATLIAETRYDWHPTRDHALRAEEALIATLNPPYNMQHRTDQDPYRRAAAAFTEAYRANGGTSPYEHLAETRRNGGLVVPGSDGVGWGSGGSQITRWRQQAADGWPWPDPFDDPLTVAGSWALDNDAATHRLPDDNW